MDLSIIIVNYNTKDLLLACLNSVIATTKRIRFEIIVVDNNSVDDSLAVLRESCPFVRIIANKENAGFARANNQGALIAQGTYVLLLNSDTIVLEGCLDSVFEYAESHPLAGVIGCKVLNKDLSLQLSCYHHPNLLTEFVFLTKGIIKDFYDPVTAWRYMRHWDHNDTRVVDSVSGCFFWVPRKVYAAMGGLDERIFMYFEDAEFCRRLSQAQQYQVHFYTEARIIHLGGASSSGTLKASSFKRCIHALNHYLKLFYSERSVQWLMILCRFVWRIESMVFSLISFSEKCRIKREFLNELLH